MKNTFIQNFRGNFKEQVDNLQHGGKPLVFTVLMAFVLMGLTCLAVFFASVQGAEKVMVPNVVGKDLKTALLEMQAKELYAKIQLKYSDETEPDTILSQSPDAGAIVKAYRRVTLTVSRGASAEIEDYTGKNIDDTISALGGRDGGRMLARMQAPVYKTDEAPKGTIIAQAPAAGAAVTDMTDIQFIVSSGNEVESVTVPDLTGMSVPQVYGAMQESSVIFDFTAHTAADGEKKDTVVSEERPGETVASYSRIKADFAFAPQTEKSTMANGILTPVLAEYPFPVDMRLTATSSEGETTTLVTFRHTGKDLTLPFSVEKNTTLALHVLSGAQEQTIKLIY